MSAVLAWHDPGISGSGRVPRESSDQLDRVGEGARSLQPAVVSHPFRLETALKAFGSPSTRCTLSVGRKHASDSWLRRCRNARDRALEDHGARSLAGYAARVTDVASEHRREYPSGIPEVCAPTRREGPGPDFGR